MVSVSTTDSGGWAYKQIELSLLWSIAYSVENGEMSGKGNQEQVCKDILP